ncbi:MAG TPA: autotransporter domain-containing protein [Rhizomicrobium sp.]|nr:autotransporter domain-containing protein [Rhizomicrobium sp.]
MRFRTLAAFCLGTSALTAPVLAASFSVGGGTIITTQADASSNLTGTGGPFALQANTATIGDSINISGVNITNTSHTPNGRALDVGGQLPSSGSYSVTMHGSVLAGDTGFGTGGAGAWFQSVGGLLSFDSTGGAANMISGKQGLVVANNTSNGGVIIKTGADTITTSSGEAIYGVAQGTGTISIDIAGATVTSSSLYGIAAVGGNGLITIGGLNGGLSGTLNVSGGSGIFTSSGGSQNITLASNGVINALNGMTLGGAGVTVDSFGTINASNNAISGASYVTLESGSVTKGKVLGSNASETFNIVAGADVTGATFDGVGGNDTLNLTGSGNGTFAVSSASNIAVFQKSGTGAWTLTGTTANVTPWIISGGTLAISNDAALGSSFGALTLDGGTLQVTAPVVSNRPITLNSGGGTLSPASGAVLTENGVIGGTGALIIAASTNAAVVLNGANTYTGGTVISGGTLQLGTPTTGGSIVGNVLNNGKLQFDRSDTSFFAGNISGAGTVWVAGQGTAILTGANTYSGGTTIFSGSTLQIGNGGTSGSTVGNIQNNGVFAVNRSDNYVFNGVISGNGSILQAGSGTLILTGSNNNFTGTTTITAGTLQIGNGTANAVLGGSIVDNSALVVDVPGNLLFGGISGSGSVQQIGSNSTLMLVGTNTYTGGTIISSGTVQLGPQLASIVASLAPTGALTVNGGVFDVNSHTQTVGALSGSGGSISLGAGLLTTDTNSNTIFAGQITGTGVLAKAGTGTLTLTGDSSWNGGTRLIGGSGVLITGGTLQLGNGGTTGSVQGNVFNDATLAFDRSDNVMFSGVIYGSGNIIKSGAGGLTLSSVSVYTGPTTVNAGTLNVTGSIASSNVSVASGATLNGTGMVGATAIQSGGTLAPGNSIGTLTVNGNLTLASGAIYNVEVSPTAADRMTVIGTASINGSVIVSVAPGTYSFGQRFTLIGAGGGVSGTFASLTGIPLSLKGQLSYDANNVYLNLSPNALAPSLSTATGNQHGVAAAIDAAVAAGNVPPAGFAALYGLSGPALNSALDQISGQIGPNVTNAVGQGFLSFLSMAVQGGSGVTGNFAPGSAYGGADAPHRAQLGAGEMRVWGAAYGGHVGLSGDSVSGAAGLSSNNVGLIGGADMQVADGVVAGVTLGLGRQLFHSGNGSGDSNDYMFSLYARARADAAYLAASFGYGWHQITTLRVVTVSGTDVLQGKQNADDFGGRIEAGWRLALDEDYGLTPYGAFAGESFESPAFAETAISGSSTFALAYRAQTTTLGRSELGAHLDRGYALDQGMLTADVRAAWAHQLDDLPFTQASFQGLAGSAFQVAGVRLGRDTALLGLDLEVQNNSGLFFGVHGEGQFGAGTTVVEGMGNFGWRW